MVKEDDPSAQQSPTPEHRKNSVVRWLNLQRVAAQIKSLTRITAIVVTALIGFIFGIANNQATDWVKRADQCSEALSQYDKGVGGEFWPLVEARNKSRSGSQKQEEFERKQEIQAISSYNTDISIPSNMVNNKCPVHGGREYLDKHEVAVWTKNAQNLDNCFDHKSLCTPDMRTIEDWKRYRYDCDKNATCLGDKTDFVDAQMNITGRLIDEANEVAEWGLGRRGKYVVLHPW